MCADLAIGLGLSASSASTGSASMASVGLAAELMQEAMKAENEGKRNSQESEGEGDIGDVGELFEPRTDLPNCTLVPQGEFEQACLEGREDVVLPELANPNFDLSVDNRKYGLIFAALGNHIELVKQMILSGRFHLSLETPQGHRAVDVAGDNESLKMCLRVFCAIQDTMEPFVGMDSVRDWLVQFANQLILNLRRTGKSAVPLHTLHMKYFGSPGTGKTSIGRLIAKILYALGLLRVPKVFEYQRTDLVAEYVGHTGPKTRKAIDAASGGVFFLDEAYSLYKPESPKDFGSEAIEEIMRHMTSESENGCLFIFAGYPEEMEMFELKANRGLLRRITNRLEFPNYSPNTIARIFMKKVEKSEYVLSEGVELDVIEEIICRESSGLVHANFNGGLADKMLEKGVSILNSHLRLDCADDELKVLAVEHIQEGLRQFVASLPRKYH